MRVNRVCKNCGITFPARSADVARGWGNFCSKSCKASKQESRTHQYANHQRSVHHDDIDYEGGGWDAHKF